MWEDDENDFIVKNYKIKIVDTWFFFKKKQNSRSYLHLLIQIIDPFTDDNSKTFFFSISARNSREHLRAEHIFLSYIESTLNTTSTTHRINSEIFYKKNHPPCIIIIWYKYLCTWMARTLSYVSSGSEMRLTFRHKWGLIGPGSRGLLSNARVSYPGNLINQLTIFTLAITLKGHFSIASYYSVEGVKTWVFINEKEMRSYIQTMPIGGWM